MQSIKRDIVIISDIGSVDPDDILTLALLLTYKNINIIGFIATHHYADRRGKLAKLFFTEMRRPEIPVYKGHGIEYETNFNQQHRDTWMKENHLFPPFFGYPRSVALSTEKIWFEKFMKGFEEFYGKEIFYKSSELEIQYDSNTFLCEQLKKHSQTNKLLVVCLAPMHDLNNLPSELFKNMELWAMGGGFEDDNNISKFLCDDSIEILKVNKAGYNWGISPESTKDVVNKLDESNTLVNLISSSFVRRNNMYVSKERFTKWMKLIEEEKCPIITKAIFKDWTYSLNANSLSDHKNICDPITLFLALDSTLGKSVQVKTQIQNEEKFKHYMEEKPESPLMVMHRSYNPNTNLYYEIDETYREQILDRIESVLFY